MTLFRWHATLTLFFLTVPVLRAGTVLSLSEATQKALAQSESVALRAVDINRLEAEYVALRSAEGPVVGFRADAFWQDRRDSSATGTGETRRYRPEAAFYLRQPLFSGFRDYAALNAQKSRSAGAAHQWTAARLSLFLEVAEVYYTVVQLDERLRGLRSVGAITENRAKDLGRRVRIGRSRQSELISTQYQQALFLAEEKNAAGQRAAALEILAALTGERPEGVVPPSGEVATLIPLNEALLLLDRRPDVAAAGEDVAVARGLYQVKNRERWPTLGFNGNYYTTRVGSNESVDWDAVLRFDLPLFRSGAWSGARAVARWELRAAELILAQTRRGAEREVRSLYSRHAALLDERDALKVASELAEANYNAQVEDERLGLVNNLDVLAALRGWEEAKVAYDERALDCLLSRHRVNVALGRGEEQP